MVRRALAGIDPNLTIFYFASYGSQVAGNFNQDRLIARLTSLFGVLALTLASVGLYGVVSFFVIRRTSEIGIRMAMGASRSSVISMVLRGVLGQILIGIALGIPVALYAVHLFASLLYRISAGNPLTYLSATMALGICATVAGLIPTLRAASIDPMRALREE
jgi:ABC-type antimicrobial peptide transport system permease subunit